MTTAQKIDEIYDGVQQIKIDYAKIVSDQEQHRKEIDKHDKKIEDLEAIKNKGIGIAIFVGTFFGAILTWIARHF